MRALGVDVAVLRGGMAEVAFNHVLGYLNYRNWAVSIIFQCRQAWIGHYVEWI